MQDLKKLTKSEIVDRYRVLQEEFEEKCLELENSEEWGGEQENRAYELMQELEKFKGNAIIDVDKFKRGLEQQDLMKKGLDEFIDNYLRWDND